ncbi:hypothetical protein BGZ99_008429, partial [Dissophora globulifera]
TTMKFTSLFVFSGLIASIATTLEAAPAALESQSGNVTKADTSSRYYNWGDLSAGDCHQTGGHLEFYSNGFFTFSATTWTDQTFSGDVWHSQFRAYSADGTRLVTTQVFNSPTMGTGQTYDYDVVGRFDPSIYNDIYSVTQSYSC